MAHTAHGRQAYSTHEMRHDGLTREYHLFVPPGLSRRSRVPLILALHGGGGSGRGLARARGQDSWIRQARRDGFIVAFPEGNGRRWNDGRVEPHRTIFGKDIPRADDVGFLDALIEELSGRYPVDKRRVFATGISNGGFMSIRLALDLSDTIAAVAPVTAQISRAVADREPRRPVAIMVINGTEDPLVPFDGGHVRIGNGGRSRGEILSTEETVRRFAGWNGCRGRPSVTDLPDRDPDDGTRIEKFHYGPCRDGREVVLLKVHGGGHTWPGGVQYLPERRVGRVSRDINATDVIADFFLSLAH